MHLQHSFPPSSAWVSSFTSLILSRLPSSFLTSSASTLSTCSHFFPFASTVIFNRSSCCLCLCSSFSISISLNSCIFFNNGSSNFFPNSDNCVIIAIILSSH